MSVIANSTTSRPSGCRRARAVALRSKSPRIADATPRPMSQRPSVTLAGLATRLLQPKRAAPSRKHSPRWRDEKGRLCSGSVCVSLRSLSSTGSILSRSASSSIAHSSAMQADRVARRAHRIRARQVELGEAMAREPVGRGIKLARRQHHRLDVVVEARGSAPARPGRRRSAGRRGSRRGAGAAPTRSDGSSYGRPAGASLPPSPAASACARRSRRASPRSSMATCCRSRRRYSG